MSWQLWKRETTPLLNFWCVVILTCLSNSGVTFFSVKYLEPFYHLFHPGSSPTARQLERDQQTAHVGHLAGHGEQDFGGDHWNENTLNETFYCIQSEGGAGPRYSQV